VDVFGMLTTDPFQVYKQDAKDVEWHETVPTAQGGPYDVRFMAPAIKRQVVHADLSFIAAVSMLPIKCISLPHPQNRQPQVMIRDTWLPLAAVNLPVPFPPLEYCPPPT
jgi:hypothetical protein